MRSELYQKASVEVEILEVSKRDFPMICESLLSSFSNKPVKVWSFNINNSLEHKERHSGKLDRCLKM